VPFSTEGVGSIRMTSGTGLEQSRSDGVGPDVVSPA